MHEKPSVEQATKVSLVLGAEACTSKRKADNPQSESKTSIWMKVLTVICQ